MVANAYSPIYAMLVIQDKETKVKTGVWGNNVEPITTAYEWFFDALTLPVYTLTSGVPTSFEMGTFTVSMTGDKLIVSWTLKNEYSITVTRILKNNVAPGVVVFFETAAKTTAQTTTKTGKE